MINLKTNNWKIENIETILFDKDGTLIDLHYFWGKMTELRACAVIKKYGLCESFFSELCYFLGYDLNSKRMIPDGITALYSRSKIIEIFCEKLLMLNINTTQKEIEALFDEVSNEFYKDILKYTKPIPDAIEFVKKIFSLGIKMGIVTSDSIVSTNLTIEQFKWEKYFDVVIGRESHFDTKESGKPTILALEKLGANPKTTLMIGDAPMDFISAKNAGIEQVVLVSSGQIEANELLKTSKYVCNSLSKIICY
ncbi:MAG: HAD family hydrolase [Candidatus Gastranaerophilales bacterium]|nr:HAD family hydrolase [Candidatus Gastranaerophilales bacterium]